ncbi:MAG: ABC transporter ATP-binding protein [Thermodesulfobacteriota bacterium]
MTASAPSQPLLQMEDVQAGHGHVQVLKGVSLSVAAGEIVALIGANGAGKSTTLMTICGQPAPRAGSIRFAGHLLNNLPPHTIAAMGIAQVPEGRRIFPRMSVAENLELGAYLRRDRPAIREDRQQIMALFPVLAERARQLAGTLSGGEQQMLAIGRALMARPRLLLLDEPSMGLAPLVIRQIFATVAAIHQQGTAILLVEQNAALALAIAHRAYCMETGRIVRSGSGAELLADPAVRAAYLGGVP